MPNHEILLLQHNRALRLGPMGLAQMKREMANV